MENKMVWEIGPKTGEFNFKELFAYRHLLARLVRKEFIVNYQQTLLGPFWILLQPLVTLVTYVFVFNNIIGVSTGGKLPPVLFYFSGIIVWNFFYESFSATSRTFRENIDVFSKVYFPRLIIPMAAISTYFLRFLIQLVLFILVLLYFMIFQGFAVEFTRFFIAAPFVIFIIGLLSLSMGLIFSVITAKYRDLGNFVEVFLRVLLFVTPVIYPLSIVKESIRWVVQMNPLTPLFELFRLGILGEGSVSSYHLLYSIIFTVVSFIAAVILFHKQGNKLIDVI